MNKFVIIALGVVAILIAIIGFIIFSKKAKAPENQKITPLKTVNTIMTITSPDFQNNAFIPKKFTCQGENVNPELEIGVVPENAKSLALIMDDPDAPMGTFTHWLLWNIAPETTVIPQNVKVEAVAIPTDASLARQFVGWEGKNSSGNIGYIGPCPPPGKPHRYFFKLYALDSLLMLDSNTPKNQLETEIQKHLVAQDELIGLYQR